MPRVVNFIEIEIKVEVSRGCWGRMGGGVEFSGDRVSIWDEKALDVDNDGGCTT